MSETKTPIPYTKANPDSYLNKDKETIAHYKAQLHQISQENYKLRDSIRIESQTTFNTTHRLANELEEKVKENVKLEAEIARLENFFKEEKERIEADADQQLNYVKVDMKNQLEEQQLQIK